MDITQWGVVYISVGIVACIAVAYRPSHVKAFNGQDVPAQMFAFAFMMLLWPFWFILTVGKGWRCRHPRKLKLS